MFLIRDLISPRTWLASIHLGIGMLTGLAAFCVLLPGYLVGLCLLPLALAGNVAKHSRASHVSVVVEGRGYPGVLTVMITDDGIGGARADGAGLRGLADRVGGVDGSLSVESPVGGPTIIAVELPCG